MGKGGTKVMLSSLQGLMKTGSGRVFSGSGISLKMVWGSPFGFSWEAGFPEIVNGCRISI